MYHQLKGGSVYPVQGLNCNLPPAGHVYNILTGKVEKRDVITRSLKKSEQYWERQDLPEWWKRKETEEQKRQLVDPDFFDSDMQRIVQREWDRRLNGVWFMNNGKPIYITGLHYFYLNWFKIDVGYPKFRIPDLEYFYFMQYCIDDPECLGMIEGTKRRFGKSYRSGVFLFEYISRAINSRGGIQSKTERDAASLFQRSVVYPFKNMPRFFRPDYDKTKGVNPKKELVFQKTAIKGKKAEDILDEEELNSVIDFRSSDKVSYDGEKLYRYVADECGKPQDVDVYDRHQVMFYCMIDDEGKIIGKSLYTSTVEELESGGAAFKMLWDDSNHTGKGDDKRTPSGLYRFFMPAHRTRYFNPYGYPDEDKALQEILRERDGLRNSPRALSARIRKEPLSESEMFRIDGDKCLYDSMKLNDRLDRLSWMKNYKTRGNFVWTDGRDSNVKFEQNETGRWEVCWLFKDWAAESNRIIKKGDLFYPDNTRSFVMGVDPYDHDSTNDSRRSKGAAFVLKRYDPSAADDDPYNYAFVAKYLDRPQTAAIFYEDMIKMCRYYGCQILFENNKIGIKSYFYDRGYGNFLVWFEGKENPGISATKQSHQDLAEETEYYIENYINSVFFPDLLQDWLNFNINDTQKYDAAMAAGYALIADKRIKLKQKDSKLIEVRDIFNKKKI